MKCWYSSSEQIMFLNFRFYFCRFSPAFAPSEQFWQLIGACVQCYIDTIYLEPQSNNGNLATSILEYQMELEKEGKERGFLSSSLMYHFNIYLQLKSFQLDFNKKLR